MQRYHTLIHNPGTQVEDRLSRGSLIASTDHLTDSRARKPLFRSGIQVMCFDQALAELRGAFIMEEGDLWN